jgi:protein gp37
MGENTKISWCDDTWNPWRGCSKVSPGCKECYAETLVNRFGGDFSKRVRSGKAVFDAPLRWNKKPCVCEFCSKAYSGDFLKEKHLCGPYHRRRVFSLSLGDWLDPEVPAEWLADMLDVVRRCVWLDFLLLTKRPELWYSRMSAVTVIDSSMTGQMCRDWIDHDPPNNVWLGVSVEDQRRSDERIPELLRIPAEVRFLSVEPLLEPIDLRLTYGVGITQNANTVRGDEISWIICGGESGPKRRNCGVEAIEDVVRQCAAAGVKCFVKQDSNRFPGQRGRLSEEAWAAKEFPELNKSVDSGPENALSSVKKAPARQPTLW